MKSIGEYAFRNCSALTSVTIGNSVTSIGKDAFSGCSGLTSVTINSNDIVSKRYSYSSSTNISSIFGSQVEEYILGESVTSIGAYAFRNCSSLTSVTIPNSVTSIEESAFYGCSGLASVAIPNSVTSIEYKTFYGCSNLTSVTIPNSVTSIGGSAFSGCSGLTSVTIPNSVTSIGVDAFNGCSGLTSPVYNEHCFAYMPVSYKGAYSIPEGIEQIVERAFVNGSGLTSVTIPNSVTSIEKETFQECSGLTSVTIPNSVTSIGNDAFRGCSSLSSVAIPNSVKTIGNWAFYGCSGLTSISCESTTPPTCYSYTFHNVDKSIPVYVPEASVAAYKAAAGWTDFTNIQSIESQGSIYQLSNEGKTLTITPGADLADVMTSLGEKNQDVTELYITGNYPNKASLNNLKSSYFPNLEKVHLTLETTATSIGNSAYLYCNLLSSIKIPSCVTSIGEAAFNHCSSLTSVADLPACQSIGATAFANCSSLTSVGDLPACQSIGVTAFEYCSSLTSVGDLSACQSIGDGAFYDCSSLTSVGDLSACQTIGFVAFEGCRSLTSIGDLSSCTSIGERVFDQWTKFKIFLNPENLNTWLTNDYITNYFRDYERQLKNVNAEGYDLVLGEDVTAISDYALQNLPGLRSVTTNSPIFTIGTNAFANCKDLVAVTFGDVESISNSAFSDCKNLVAVTFTGDTPAALANVDAFTNYCVIYVPASKLGAYHTAENWQSHASQIIAIGCQEDYDVNVTADSNMSSLHVAIGENNLLNVTSLKVTGTINSYDLMLMRNKMTNLKSLDLTDARIVANPYEYYQGFSSVTDVLTRHSMPDNVFTLALPASIKQINSYALSDFTNLRKLQIPASVETMEESAANGNAVTDIYFTEGSLLSSLGNNAFQNCKGLVDPKLEYTSIPTIGNNTFYGCSNMVRVSIPSSVAIIKEEAFIDCGNLAELNIDDSEEELSVARIVYIDRFNQKHYYPAFRDCGKFTSLYLGRNIKGIDNPPFSDRSSLKTVEIGSKVTALADNLFENCSGIEELTGDLSNIEYIGNRTFYGCSKLPEFTFSDKIKSISEYAFYGCSALKSIDIPVNITTLGQHTFDGCTAATECVIPANSQISTIPTYCFANCTSLKKVNLPVSVKEIEDYAFYNCTGMEEAKISSAVNHVGDYAFNGCTKLFDVYTYTIEPQAINQNTFSQFSGATLHVPAVSWYNYYYDTQWSQFLKMVNFDEPYDYVFVEKDFTLRTDQLGIIKGNPQFDIWGGGALIIAGNLLQMAKDCYLGFKNGKWGSIIPSCGNFKPQTLYVNIDVDKDFWYAFSFPFDVDLTKVKTSSCGDYVFRRYDGAMRAENGSGGWQPVTGNTLKANTGYIFRTNEAGTLSIPITAPQFSTIDKIIDILTHPSSIGAEHAGWNFIGNPFTAYYSMNDMNYEAPIMVWNGTNYEAYRPGDDDHVFHPFEAFFVQRPSNKSSVSFKMNNRMSCNESEAMQVANAKKVSFASGTGANAKRSLINLTLSDGTMTDKCRVVYNDEQFMGYDADCDAAKFISSENVPQIYTIDDNGTKYAINERPMQDSKVMLGYVANADGKYTIAAPRMDAKVVIFDNEENVLHDFADGDYTFETVAGTNNTRFALYTSNMVPTDVKEIVGADVDAESNGDAYDISGRKVLKAAKGVIIKNGMKQVVK